MVRTLDDLRTELIAVARGERPATPPPTATDRAVDEFHMPTTSSLLLMRTVALRSPASVNDLAEITGRKQSNVSRDLQELAKHGLVRLVRDGKTIRPEVVSTHLDIDILAGSCRPVPRQAAE